jgi:hypothetical protein
MGRNNRVRKLETDDPLLIIDTITDVRYQPLPVGVKTGGYGRIVAHHVSYPNVFKMDSGSDTDS